jgi:hypothetical protein
MIKHGLDETNHIVSEYLLVPGTRRLRSSNFAPIQIATMTTHIPFFTLPEQFFNNAALSTLFPLALGFGLGLWTSRWPTPCPRADPGFSMGTSC